MGMKLFFIKRTDTGQYLEWQRIVPRWTTRDNAVVYRSRAFAADTADTISSNDNIPVEIETFDIDAGQEALKMLAYLVEYDYIEDYDARQDAERLIKTGG